MFKNIASDALGLSDIGKFIDPSEYNQTESDDFLIGDEKIYALIKTKSDEYCFTNKALIHIDGQSAMSKKRTMHRYEYLSHDIFDVRLETASALDLDMELEFVIGKIPVKIEIHKKYAKEVSLLYKALIEVAHEMYKNGYKYETAERCLTIAATSVGRVSGEGNVADAYREILDTVHDYYFKQQSKYYIEEFGFIFAKYFG